MKSMCCELLVVALAMCLHLGAASAQPVSNNLMYNGALENAPVTSPPDGWLMWGDDKWKNPANYTVDGSVKHSGSCSFRIHHPANTGGYVCSDDAHAIRVHPGCEYKLSFWVRADRSATAALRIWGAAPGPTDGYTEVVYQTFDVGTEWRQISLKVEEGWDFQRSSCAYLRLCLWGASEWESDATIWVDDISVVESQDSRGGRLVDESTLPYPRINHRLRPGDALDFSIDPAKILWPTSRDIAGISYHRVAGYPGVPYDEDGKYTLKPELEAAVRDLKLPMTRIYGVGDEKFGLEGSLDRAAHMVDTAGIPQDHTVIELEDQEAARTLSPSVWAHAVEYCRSKGYRFNHWEICNEPYASLWGAKTAFPNADSFIAHFTEVSDAIRKTAADAQIGIDISWRSVPWGNYVLRQAAGRYDFVAPHYYAGLEHLDGTPFQDIVLASNYSTLDMISRQRELIRAYNPNRDVYLYDTEWSMTGGSDSNFEPRNGNIMGVAYRAVRMIYCARENILHGSSGWAMFGNARLSGMSTLSQDTPDQRYLSYWLYYYFNRCLGTNVLAIAGTAPYYIPENAAKDLQPGPLTPVLATIDGNGKTIYVIAVNGSWDRNIPCTIRIAGFPIASAEGASLSQKDRNSPPLVASKGDAIHDLSFALQGSTLTCSLPPHSVDFITLQKR